MGQEIHCIAIDWSGNKNPKQAAKRIWLAHTDASGRVIEFENGRGREQIVEYLRQFVNSRVVVGLDFAFSLPSWYVSEKASTEITRFWEWAYLNGEGILKCCPRPFWGRKGTKAPQGICRFRLTEREVIGTGGGTPKSVFQIAGRGAVGTGSLRGMRHLLTLRQMGFSVWPFDEPQCPLIVEIYPRILTGLLNKSSPEERVKYLTKNYPQLSEAAKAKATSSDDAFDALVSALVMSKYAATFESMTPPPQIAKIEGWIWAPPD